MAFYKIRHALASWTNDDLTPGMAFRGQVVDIPDAEAERLKKHFAIIPPTEEVEHPGILQDLPISPSDEEILNWISNANVSEVRALVSSRPELTPRIEGALTNVKAARAYEDTHLNEMRMALQQGGLKADDDNIILGSGASSGHDATDTSAEPGDDITVAGNTPTVPTAPGLPPMDPSVLVEGSAQDVANYIGAHPEEAATILDAETAHTNGAPRVEVVSAVRAATGFTS